MGLRHTVKSCHRLHLWAPALVRLAKRTALISGIFHVQHWLCTFVPTTFSTRRSLRSLFSRFRTNAGWLLFDSEQRSDTGRVNVTRLPTATAAWHHLHIPLGEGIGWPRRRGTGAFKVTCSLRTLCHDCKVNFAALLMCWEYRSAKLQLSYK